MIYDIDIAYVIAAAIFAVSWGVLWGIKKVIIGRLARLAEKTEGDLDDALVSILETINPLVLGVAALDVAIRFSGAPALLTRFVSAAFLIALVYQVSVGVARVVDVAIQKKQGKRVHTNQKAAVNFLSVSVKWLIWLLGGLLVLSNLGVDITALIAGLGIGGVAIALALQNVLSDLFASFSIYFDKPFEVGDFIIVGANMGTVEKIGIKTTRLRALQGEEIVISNAELTTARIQNFKKMRERRVVVQIGVLYETPHELLKEIPALIKSAFSGLDKVRFDRANLATYADFSINYELVYYVLSGDYNEYMNINEQALLDIKAMFDAKGIVFAYPTQTLYVKK